MIIKVRNSYFSVTPVNRCELCERYVREHTTDQGARVFDRHTIAPFDPTWCTGSTRTHADTVKLRAKRHEQSHARQVRDTHRSNRARRR